MLSAVPMAIPSQDGDPTDHSLASTSSTTGAVAELPQSLEKTENISGTMDTTTSSGTTYQPPTVNSLSSDEGAGAPAVHNKDHPKMTASWTDDNTVSHPQAINIERDGFSLLLAELSKQNAGGVPKRVSRPISTISAMLAVERAQKDTSTPVSATPPQTPCKESKKMSHDNDIQVGETLSAVLEQAESQLLQESGDRKSSIDAGSKPKSALRKPGSKSRRARSVTYDPFIAGPQAGQILRNEEFIPSSPINIPREDTTEEPVPRKKIRRTRASTAPDDIDFQPTSALGTPESKQRPRNQSVTFAPLKVLLEMDAEAAVADKVEGSKMPEAESVKKKPRTEEIKNNDAALKNGHLRPRVNYFNDSSNGYTIPGRHYYFLPKEHSANRYYGADPKYFEEQERAVEEKRKQRIAETGITPIETAKGSGSELTVECSTHLNRALGRTPSPTIVVAGFKRPNFAHGVDLEKTDTSNDEKPEQAKENIAPDEAGGIDFPKPKEKPQTPTKIAIRAKHERKTSEFEPPYPTGFLFKHVGELMPASKQGFPDIVSPPKKRLIGFGQILGKWDWASLQKLRDQPFYSLMYNDDFVRFDRWGLEPMSKLRDMRTPIFPDNLVAAAEASGAWKGKGKMTEPSKSQAESAPESSNEYVIKPCTDSEIWGGRIFPWDRLHRGEDLLEAVQIPEELEYCYKCGERHIEKGPLHTLNVRDTCGAYLPDYWPKHLYPTDSMKAFVERVNATLALERASKDLPQNEEMDGIGIEKVKAWDHQYHEKSDEWRAVGRHGGFWTCRLGSEDPNVPDIEKNCSVCSAYRLELQAQRDIRDAGMTEYERRRFAKEREEGWTPYRIEQTLKGHRRFLDRYAKRQMEKDKQAVLERMKFEKEQQAKPKKPEVPLWEKHHKDARPRSDFKWDTIPPTKEPSTEKSFMPRIMPVSDVGETFWNVHDPKTKGSFNAPLAYDPRDLPKHEKKHSFDLNPFSKKVHVPKPTRDKFDAPGVKYDLDKAPKRRRDLDMKFFHKGKSDDMPAWDQPAGPLATEPLEWPPKKKHFDIKLPSLTKKHDQPEFVAAPEPADPAFVSPAVEVKPKKGFFRGLLKEDALPAIINSNSDQALVDPQLEVQPKKSLFRGFSRGKEDALPAMGRFDPPEVYAAREEPKKKKSFDFGSSSDGRKAVKERLRKLTK